MGDHQRIPTVVCLLFFVSTLGVLVEPIICVTGGFEGVEAPKIKLCPTDGH